MVKNGILNQICKASVLVESPTNSIIKMSKTKMIPTAPIQRNQSLKSSMTRAHPLLASEERGGPSANLYANHLSAQIIKVEPKATVKPI